MKLSELVLDTAIPGVRAPGIITAAEGYEIELLHSGCISLRFERENDPGIVTKLHYILPPGRWARATPAPSAHVSEAATPEPAFEVIAVVSAPKEATPTLEQPRGKAAHRKHPS